MRHLRGRRHPVRSRGELVDRIVAVAGEVLDRAPGQTGGHGPTDGLRHTGRVVGVAVLEVGGHGHVRGLHDRPRVGQRLVAGDPAVQAAEGRREAAARGGQRARSPARRAASPSPRPTGSASTAVHRPDGAGGTALPCPPESSCRWCRCSRSDRTGGAGREINVGPASPMGYTCSYSGDGNGSSKGGGWPGDGGAVGGLGPAAPPGRGRHGVAARRGRRVWGVRGGWACHGDRVGAGHLQLVAGRGQGPHPSGPPGWPDAVGGAGLAVRTHRGGPGDGAGPPLGQPQGPPPSAGFRGGAGHAGGPPVVSRLPDGVPPLGSAGR